MRYCVAAVLLALCIIARFGSSPPSANEEQLLMQLLQQSAEQIPLPLLTNRNQIGLVRYAQDGGVVSTDELWLRTSETDWLQGNSYAWRDGAGKIAMVSANAPDHHQYFANSFLVGVRPFAIDNPALPLHYLAKRKVYQLDALQYGSQEVWQNSAQAWQNLRGDCEDHAMILADWLLSEGYDAKVVLGRYKNEGHAWVIANLQGKTFLLEATNKAAGSLWQQYPLAGLDPHYAAEFMFNREHFWQNNGNKFDGDYQSKQWQLTGDFISQSKAP